MFFNLVFVGLCGCEAFFVYFYVFFFITPFFVFVLSSIVIASKGKRDLPNYTHNVVITSLRRWNDVMCLLGDCFASVGL